MKDRFGSTALDNARQFDQKECERILEEAQMQRNKNEID